MSGEQRFYKWSGGVLDFADVVAVLKGPWLAKYYDWVAQVHFGNGALFVTLAGTRIDPKSDYSISIVDPCALYESVVKAWMIYREGME